MINHSRNLLSLFAAWLLSVPFLACSSEQDLFTLSFEELLDVNINLATKTDETRATVPSSTTVFTNQHIALLGVNNVYDLMNYVPGFQSTRGDWVGAVPKEHTRGVFLNSGNVLVMINGQRLNEASFGKASVYMPHISVDIVDKVEFIRGPGSALYGSNAFLGVMNIITFQEGSQASVGIGEYGFTQVAGSFNKSLFEQTNVYGNVSWQGQDGEKYAQGVRDPLASYFLEFGVQWRELNLSVWHNQTQLNGFANLAGWSNENKHKSENTALSLTYHWLRNTDWDVSSSLKHIEHNIYSAGLIATGEELGLEHDFYVGPSWQSKDLALNLDVAYRLNEFTSVNIGLEYSEEEQSEAGINTSYYDFSRGDVFIDEEFYQDGIITVKPHAPFNSLLQSFDSTAAYAQLKHVISEDLTVFVGARYDDVKDIDSKLSPRVAAIYKVSPSNTLKLQYGESFRTPVSNELNSNDDVTVGNPNLTSEYVKTTELVWHTQKPDWELDIVLFDNQLKDFINLVPIRETALPTEQRRFTFLNTFNTNMQGYELNSKFNVSDTTWLELGYTHLFDEPFSPSFKRFASLSFTHNMEPLQLSINTIWRDSVFVSSPEPDVIDNFDQGAYNLVGAVLSWRLGNNRSISLKAQNLFDKNYFVFEPRMFDGKIQGAGRRIQLQYLQKF
ncbi:TonB-dependent receptor plug domain-containing protein [Pseudoalteromonas byunsanensis]|uniref:Ferric-rhodotorulic acid transporter n=1 Tax=Pseudoalteromonas byunsanensis TaxID=327939 RepID=A0A1S1N470_9GAMM|nr:TonB-dependent receptor [Pseudoalteromonas byunsanensis]OHU94459.1 ferric-rhodotorulic acid transporter [Pseudoalteromonas byunsanensis]